MRQVDLDVADVDAAGHAIVSWAIVRDVVALRRRGVYEGRPVRRRHRQRRAGRRMGNSRA